MRGMLGQPGRVLMQPEKIKAPSSGAVFDASGHNHHFISFQDFIADHALHMRNEMK